MNDIELFCCVQTLGSQIQVKTFRIDCASVLLMFFFILKGVMGEFGAHPSCCSCIPKSCSNKKNMTM